MRAVLTVLLFLFFMQTEPSLPPPLTYRLYEETDDNNNYVYNFENGQIESIAQPPRPSTQKASSVPLKEFIFHAPSDASIQFVMIDESDPQTEILEDGYTLYRIDERAVKHHILDFALRIVAWSSNDAYVYISAQGNGNSTLYQYDIVENRLRIFFDNFYTISQCQQTICLMYQRKTDDLELFIFNKETNTVTSTGIRSTYVLHAGETIWISHTREFLYAQYRSQTTFTLHRYNIETNMDTFIAEINGQYRNMVLSPDKRWLMLWILIDDSGKLVLVDMQNLTAQPRWVGQNYTLSNHTQSTPTWLSETEITFEVAINKKTFGFYRLNIQTDEINIYAEFSDGQWIPDHDWSPDGQWLAYIIYIAKDYNNELYIVPTNGSLSPRHIELPTNEIGCIGWINPEGNDPLCDKYWGEG